MVEVGLRVVQPFAVAGGKLYCSTVAGRIIAVDAESGRFIAGSQPMPLAALVINQSSDRLYVADTAGRMQCLRPWQSTLPRLVEPLRRSKERPHKKLRPTATRETTPAAADQDPFNLSGGAAASPAGSNPTDSASDPFGTVAPTGDGLRGCRRSIR
ncbi:MAG: PQQ-binding-like beta-propeller repeat protein [Pirellulaceae bacterium]